MTCSPGSCADAETRSRHVGREMISIGAATSGERHWRRLKAEMPPPSQEVFEREQRGVLEDLSLFVERRSANAIRRTSHWLRGVVRPAE